MCPKDCFSNRVPNFAVVNQHVCAAACPVDVMARLTACVRCGAQSAQSILTMFDERLQRQALASFEQSGVEVRTGVRVVEVTQEQVCPGTLAPHGTIARCRDCEHAKSVLVQHTPMQGRVASEKAVWIWCMSSPRWQSGAARLGAALRQCLHRAQRSVLASGRLRGQPPSCAHVGSR
jgi:hypothetical protein